MAVLPTCAILERGQDSACKNLKRRYYQQAVLINKADINPASIVYDFATTDVAGKYSVQFELFEGKKGYKFIGPESGSSFFGTYDKSTSDLGFVQYIHNANLLVVGADEDAKSILSALDKANLVVAYQFTDGTVEIYGLENGLSTQDYSYDVQGGGGGGAVILSSRESSPENYLPLVYKPAQGGDANADFNSNFENPIEGA